MIAALDFTGLAAVITSLAVLAATLRNGKVGRDTLAHAEEVNHAVNGQPPGAPTIQANAKALVPMIEDIQTNMTRKPNGFGQKAEANT